MARHLHLAPGEIIDLAQEFGVAATACERVEAGDSNANYLVADRRGRRHVLAESLMLGSPQVLPQHILMGLVGQEGCEALWALEGLGLDAQAVHMDALCALASQRRPVAGASA